CTSAPRLRPRQRSWLSFATRVESSTLRLPRWSQQRLISRIAPSARVVRTANEVGDPLNEPPPPVESHTTFSRAGQFPKSRNPRWPGRRRLFLRGATRRQSCDERRARGGERNPR